LPRAAFWPSAGELLLLSPQADHLPTGVVTVAIADMVVITISHFPAGAQLADLPARPAGLLAMR